MPKHKSLADKEKDIKELIKLTWEAVRLNQEYRANYIKFTANFGLTPEDLKPQKKEGVTCPPKTDPHVKLEWWIEGRQGDEQEAFYPGADHQEVTGSRGGHGPG